MKTSDAGGAYKLERWMPGQGTAFVRFNEWHEHAIKMVNMQFGAGDARLSDRRRRLLRAQQAELRRIGDFSRGACARRRRGPIPAHFGESRGA